ncbi:unnamed protein product, partial [Rotaria sp. Silwood1]
MENGNWIILDNSNCACGNVVEDLNPLAEAEPTLTLYKSATSRQYCHDNGNTQSFR